MSVVLNIEGREAIPVRAVLLVTSGNVNPQDLAFELSKPDDNRAFTAYKYADGKVTPVRAESWSLQLDVLTDVARGFKHNEEKPDLHRQAALIKLTETLPVGVFVWLDEFEKWYTDTTYWLPYSTLEEIHRCVGEDDDPEPQYRLENRVSLDLDPIALTDMMPMIQEGFEVDLATMAAVHEVSPYVKTGEQVSSDAPLLIPPDQQIQIPPVAATSSTEQNTATSEPNVTDGDATGSAKSNWRYLIQTAAWDHWLRLRASGCNPSVYSICEDMAKWCIEKDIKGDKGQNPRAGTIRNAVLGAGHWVPPHHSVVEAQKYIAQTAQTEVAQTKK
jgi:hypothetical protein